MKVFWTDRINRLAGVSMLLLVALTIVVIIVPTMVTADADPTSRTELEGMLRDIHDDRAMYVVGLAADVATNIVIVALVAPSLYFLFRDRSGVLAMVGFAGLLAGGIVFLVGNAAAITTVYLAADFVEEGGVGGIAAGDAAILQSARGVVIFGALTEPVGSTAIGIALLSLGTVAAWAPRGDVNPPRWLGAVAILSGVGLLIRWAAWPNDALAAVVVTVGYVAALVWFAGLGGWLLMRGEEQTHAGTARLAPSV